MRTHIADMPMITMLVPRDLAVFELESMVHLLIRRYLHIRMLMNAGILIDDAAIRITNRKVILDFLSISRPITSILKIPTDRRPAWGYEWKMICGLASAPCRQNTLLRTKTATNAKNVDLKMRIEKPPLITCAKYSFR